MCDFSRRLASAVAAFALFSASGGPEAAPFLYVAESGTNLVRVVDTANDAVVAHIGVGQGPRSLVMNAAGTRAYVANSGETTVSVIDTATNRVVATIPVGEAPLALAVNAAGTRIYVSISGRYPTYQGSAVAVIDGGTNTVIANIAVGTVPRALALTPDGTRLYVANVESRDISVVDTATNKSVARIAVESPPEGGLAVDPSGSRVYATLPFEAKLIVIDVATQTVAATLRADWDPTGIALDAAGTRAYVADSGSDFFLGRTVYVIDLASLSVSAKVPVGTYPHDVYLDRASGSVYVASPGADTVAIIDPATNKVTRTIPVGRFPLALALGRADATPSGGNYQGLWWNAPAGSESGWGVNLTHQGDILFATWSTYDADGSALWLVMPNGTMTGASTYTGALYRMTGSPPGANGFAATSTAVGSATFAFTSVDSGTFTYTVQGKTQSKAIVRYAFASPTPICTAGGTPSASQSYQDLWWRSPAGSEPGWGVNITHQAKTLFATWFTYDAAGKAQWLVMSKGVLNAGGTAYSGTLHRTTGPAFDASPWISAQVRATAVGTATFTFGEDPDEMTFAYTLDGISRSQPITRFRFASPATHCR